MTHYVFSTLANDQNYQNWHAGEGGNNNPGHSVFIKGGSGIANDRLVTPQGVMTTISDDDLAALEQNEVFKLHRSKGHIVVKARSADPEKIASDMNRADPSAPRTPADYAGEAEEAVKLAS